MGGKSYNRHLNEFEILIWKRPKHDMKQKQTETLYAVHYIINEDTSSWRLKLLMDFWKWKRELTQVPFESSGDCLAGSTHWNKAAPVPLQACVHSESVAALLTQRVSQEVLSSYKVQLVGKKKSSQFDTEPQTGPDWYTNFSH